jgi:hypothetical protein
MKIYANDKYIIIESDGIEVKLVKMINGELYDTGHMRIIGDITVKSIQDIISYIHSNYTVSSLDLIDECVKDGIPMSMLRYLTTENSWYEDNFGKSTDDMCNFFYDNEKRVLYNKKTNTSWDKFMNLTWVHMISIPLDETKELYMKAKTWQEFFVPLIERVEFNEAFSEFFNTFLCIYVGHHNLAFRYSIPVRNYP